MREVQMNSCSPPFINWSIWENPEILWLSTKKKKPKQQQQKNSSPRTDLRKPIRVTRCRFPLPSCRLRVVQREPLFGFKGALPLIKRLSDTGFLMRVKGRLHGPFYLTASEPVKIQSGTSKRLPSCSSGTSAFLTCTASSWIAILLVGVCE